MLLGTYCCHKHILLFHGQSFCIGQHTLSIYSVLNREFMLIYGMILTFLLEIIFYFQIVGLFLTYFLLLVQFQAGSDVSSCDPLTANPACGNCTQYNVTHWEPGLQELHSQCHSPRTRPTGVILNVYRQWYYTMLLTENPADRNCTQCVQTMIVHNVTHWEPGLQELEPKCTDNDITQCDTLRTQPTGIVLNI